VINLDSKSIRFLSRMGARGSFGQAIIDLADGGLDFFAVPADLARASGFDRLIARYPEKFVDVGIAEQNLVGVAAGLAKGGLPVFATSWAMFSSLRCADQVRNFLGFMQLNVKLVGMDSGMAQSRFGYSHTNPPDMALMRAIPGVAIVSPCDGLEIYKATCAIAEQVGPVYLRLTGDAMVPAVHRDPAIDFRIGKAILLAEGTEVAFVGCGCVLHEVMAAARALETRGVSCTVLDMHTIRPLDTQALDALLSQQVIVTVEEHGSIGGLGGAVAEHFAPKRIRPPHLLIGAEDRFPEAGRREYVMDRFGLTSEQISARVERFLQDQA
jgi:transketolase